MVNRRMCLRCDDRPDPGNSYCCWKSTDGRGYSVKESTFHLQMHEGYRPLGFRVRHHATTLLALLVGYVACVLAGCSATSWKSPLGRNHPLAGRIWDVSSDRFIDRETLVERLARADFVLLGERHDNPDHHMLQAEVLRSLIAVGRHPAVGI